MWSRRRGGYCVEWNCALHNSMRFYGGLQMKRTDLPNTHPIPVIAMVTASPGGDKPAIRVKELSERDRRNLLMHFLALDGDDRLLRFGSVLSDEAMTRYVQMLDFSRNSVFGVYDDDQHLLGAGLLAFVAREAHPAFSRVTTKTSIAEFGVSVLPHARGRGIGTKLFQRAAFHCRNKDVDILFMHCLASNQAMIHIASKARMEICRDGGDSNVCLHLLPVADASGVRQEAKEEESASVDYALKANTKAAAKWWRWLPGSNDENE